MQASNAKFPAGKSHGTDLGPDAVQYVYFLCEWTSLIAGIENKLSEKNNLFIYNKSCISTRSDINHNNGFKVDLLQI